MPPSHAAPLARLDRDPWAARLPHETRAALLAALRPRLYRRGEALFRQGEAAAHFCCLLEGELEVSTVTPTGRAHVLTHLFPVRWFAEMSFLDGLPRSHSVVATRESLVAAAPRAKVLRLMETHDALYRGMVGILCENMRLLFMRVDEFQKRSVEALAANTLLNYVPDARAGAVEISQTTLASLIGASRQSVNACLSRWERAGVVARSYRRITVTDLDALRRIAAA
ncbi:MAG: Crp/Fnr family transcriptional regulator [Pseudomonadota bacterium]